ncbi:MAG: hypothetical protein GY866_02185 [Proteobacteria bacterium]|nr:hypothetical protein [Pseudomonadota bacterium]
MTLPPNTRFLATGVGSMPFQDAGQAVNVSVSNLEEAPFWPQLTQLDLNEQMDVQFSEGIPCVVIDRQKNRMYFDTSGDYSDSFAEFYEYYLAAMDPDEGNGDCSALAISADFSKGIYAFEKRVQEDARTYPYIKVQTTGPCTFALNTVDETKRAIFYNEEFRDVIVKALAMKCRWQIQKFKKYAKKIICFIDEPILSAFGSSTYVSVQREDIVELLGEMIDAVHADDAVAGVHCCGNTEWSILVDAGVDLLNFDAFEFGESIAMYPDAVKMLFDRGGTIAWGIVPTSTAIREYTVESLADRLDKTMDNLADKGIDKQLILERAIITPSCGTGSMDPADAEKVFETTRSLSKYLREKYT